MLTIGSHEKHISVGKVYLRRNVYHMLMPIANNIVCVCRSIQFRSRCYFWMVFNKFHLLYFFLLFSFQSFNIERITHIHTPPSFSHTHIPYGGNMSTVGNEVLLLLLLLLQLLSVYQIGPYPHTLRSSCRSNTKQSLHSTQRHTFRIYRCEHWLLAIITAHSISISFHLSRIPANPFPFHMPLSFLVSRKRNVCISFACATSNKRSRSSHETESGLLVKAYRI